MESDLATRRTEEAKQCLFWGVQGRLPRGGDS